MRGVAAENTYRVASGQASVVAEYQRLTLQDKPANAAHAAGIKAENAASGWTRNAETGWMKSRSGNISGTNKIDYSRGNLHSTVSIRVSRGNVTKVKR